MPSANEPGESVGGGKGGSAMPKQNNLANLQTRNGCKQPDVRNTGTNEVTRF